MELMFVALGGTIIGLLARYSLDGRHEHGALLLPATGAVVASAVWAALTWAGWRFDGGWIWTASLVASFLVTFGLALVLPRRRRARDSAMLAQLVRA